MVDRFKVSGLMLNPTSLSQIPRQSLSGSVSWAPVTCSSFWTWRLLCTGLGVWVLGCHIPVFFWEGQAIFEGAVGENSGFLRLSSGGLVELRLGR